MQFRATMLMVWPDGAREEQVFEREAKDFEAAAKSFAMQARELRELERDFYQTAGAQVSLVALELVQA